ncbi:acyl-CoA dehydrogenase/oxidase [Gorgonomyces haynaldii]|nr:acyl-CoA dehydrogenase/oxidase [Gorgonomyces haynaldii]
MQSFDRDHVPKDKRSLVIIDSVVYDITDFAAMHPGGEQLLNEHKGTDVTELFYAYHRQDVLDKYQRLQVGTIKGEKPKILRNVPGQISQVPYAEPSYLQGFKSHYYKQSHHDLRIAVRKFLKEHAYEEAVVGEETGEAASQELFEKLGSTGILAMRMGPGPHLKPFQLIGGVKPEEFDYFHEMIVHEEFSNLGFPGFQDSLATGMVIGLPPIMHFAKKQVKERVVPLVLTGKKRICLAITEPGAGSDVANIKTRAVLSPDGKHYIVNGVKKWITGAKQSDFFTTAVVTDGGISMLLIERTEGVETKQIKTSYSSAAGTSYIVFENVKVPVENLLGVEGGGFLVIMYNFNHERWFIIAGIIAACRAIVSECFKWANQREVFGKKLLEQAVIRFKLANMISEVESAHNWLENMTFQMTQMSYKEQSIKLAGPLALLKFRATRCAHDVSDDACQIFGGRAITKTGMGRNVEAFQRTYKFAAILGGSEEIMADLGVRQAMKFFPKNARL